VDLLHPFFQCPVHQREDREAAVGENLTVQGMGDQEADPRPLEVWLGWPRQRGRNLEVGGVGGKLVVLGSFTKYFSKS
jgi:hypothetical protein